MPWFLIALLNPILHAGVNHLDKYLISKYFRNIQVGSFVIFSGLFSVILLPIVIFLSHAPFSITISNGLILAVNGTLVVIGVMSYLYALNEDETSFVVPLFQITPIFGLILSFLFLGEVVQFSNIMGAIVVLFGSAVLSLDIKGEKFKFKKKVVFFMLIACLCYAINIVIFKSIALDNGFWESLIWDLVGKIIFAIFLFTFINSFRSAFLTVLQTYKLKFVLLTGLDEMLTIFGDWALVFSALMAPVFFVQLVSATQPIFVFIFGVILTFLYPQIGREILERKLLFQKLFGITMVIIGAIILSF
ncbi:DMT family transporter [Candidatus Nomurabacteria bacterium]|nr:DMT family transporter [Candidatus Nomurabacteria bacterium]